MEYDEFKEGAERLKKFLREFEIDAEKIFNRVNHDEMLPYFYAALKYAITYGNKKPESAQSLAGICIDEKHVLGIFEEAMKKFNCSREAVSQNVFVHVDLIQIIAEAIAMKEDDVLENYIVGKFDKPHVVEISIGSREKAKVIFPYGLHTKHYLEALDVFTEQVEIISGLAYDGCEEGSYRDCLQSLFNIMMKLAHCPANDLFTIGHKFWDHEPIQIIVK